jgi:hypothetical protein
VRGFGVALLLALALLAAGRQITLHRWYSASPVYRAQVDAMLTGRLALSEAPEAIQHDFAWTERGVQQVWGLGVPLWQLPFEVVGRAVGCSPFPDRVALLAWLALAFAAVIRAWWRRDEPWLGVGCVVITALLPPIVTLVRGRLGVYEEAALYSYAAAAMLLSATQRLAESSGRTRYLVLLAGAGATGLMRPTVWFYGLATAIVASALYLNAHGRRAIATVALGAALFAAGGAALYATNARRFGDGMEFGHRINLESLPGNLYATRFSYPFARASLPTALAEELGALFDRPDKHVHTTFYGRNLHVGQAAIPRWREYYFTTFTWGYAPIVLIGLVLGALAWRRRRPGPERWLLAWAILGGAPLFAFYLRMPSMTSRYQLDLAPAFVALLLIAWRAFARRARAGVAIGVLAAAWIASVALARTAQPRSADPVARTDAAAATYEVSRATAQARALPVAYDLADPWAPADTVNVEAFDRCFDEAGTAIDPDSPPLGGERCAHGELQPDGQQWLLATTAVAVSTGTLECTSERPVCEPDATVASSGEITVAPVPAPTLYLNLFRWDLTTGEVPSATYAWVQDPAYIELEVATFDDRPTDWAREIRVAVGRTHLHLKSIASTTRGVRLRFEGAPLPRGLAVAFLAFGPDDELTNVHTRYALQRVQWRDR